MSLNFGWAKQKAKCRRRKQKKKKKKANGKQRVHNKRAPTDNLAAHWRARELERKRVCVCVCVYAKSRKFVRSNFARVLTLQKKTKKKTD